MLPTCSPRGGRTGSGSSRCAARWAPLDLASRFSCWLRPSSLLAPAPLPELHLPSYYYACSDRPLWQCFHPIRPRRWIHRQCFMLWRSFWYARCYPPRSRSFPCVHMICDRPWVRRVRAATSVIEPALVQPSSHSRLHLRLLSSPSHLCLSPAS